MYSLCLKEALTPVLPPKNPKTLTLLLSQHPQRPSLSLWPDHTLLLDVTQTMLEGDAQPLTRSMFCLLLLETGGEL
jgi:hypothetical protein